MLKTILEKNTLKNSQLQSLYNNLSDTKNVSLLGPNALNQDGGERQPQDIFSQDSILNSIASMRDMASVTGVD
jgi:hypothetical protein